MAKYLTLLTHIGAAKIANATALGTKINLTQMAVGDANGNYSVPNPAQTRLISEKRRAGLNSLTIDEKNPNQIIAEQIIPDNEGGYWVREIGLYDDQGDLIAIGNCPESYKPLLQEGSGRTQTIRMIIVVSHTEAVTLKTDPSVVLASREYVDKKVLDASKEPLSGYGTVGSFEEGLLHIKELTNIYQQVLFKENNSLYYWSGSFPHYVPKGSTPESTGGIGQGKWISASGQDHTKGLDYFINITSSFCDALDKAIIYANEGNIVTSGNIKKILLDKLPSIKLKSNATLRFDNLIIETDIPISPKGSGIFSGTGSVDASVYADLLVDVDEYKTTYRITNVNKFKVGDFISARYTTKQDNKIIPTNNFSNEFDLYEFTAKIIAIEANDITVDVCRSYKVFANPPAGGKFRIYKCNPIENVEVSGVTVIDKNNSESASHSVVALYFSANHKIENIRGENMKGTVAYFENCYGHISNYTTNIRPRSTEAGRGYTEQHLACSNGLSTAPYSEAGRHCVDHAAGSTGMVVFRGKGKGMKEGVFGCHGSFENNIVYSECEADSSPQSPLIYLATSGEVFGNHCKDIKIISPKGRGMGALLYSAAAESRTENVSIEYPDFREHAGANYAVRCNMSNTSITGGYIDGGIQVAAIFAPNEFRTDLEIDGTIIKPNKAGNFLHSGDTFGKKIRFTRCDTAGHIVLTNQNVSIEFNGGDYTYLYPELIHPRSQSQLLCNYTAINMILRGDIQINDRVTSQSISMDSIRYNVTGKVELDGVIGGVLKVTRTDGDIEITARRAAYFDFVQNKTTKKLSIMQSPNSRLRIANNDLKSSEPNGLCFEIYPTEQNGIALIFSANTHAEKINFADNSGNVIARGSATGNVYLGSGVQTVGPNIIKSGNFGYS